MAGSASFVGTTLDATRVKKLTPLGCRRRGTRSTRQPWLLEAGRRLAGVDVTKLVYQYRELPGAEPCAVERLAVREAIGNALIHRDTAA
ncbi:MAG: hypothetical protein ACRDSE_22310 [Pseudonocardiaceae bacterium]